MFSFVHCSNPVCSALVSFFFSLSDGVKNRKTNFTFKNFQCKPLFFFFYLPWTMSPLSRRHVFHFCCSLRRIAPPTGALRRRTYEILGRSLGFAVFCIFFFKHPQQPHQYVCVIEYISKWCCVITTREIRSTR